MNYPQEGTRDWALYKYLVQEMMANGGVAPSIRQIIADKVGEQTSMGAMTSTSIVTYHLEALAKMGLVETGGRRGIRLVGAKYLVPNNHQKCRWLDDYNLVLIDSDLEPIDVPGRVIPWLPTSTVRAMINFGMFHTYYEAIVQSTIHYGKVMSDVAVITDTHSAEATALVLGIGVFGSGVFLDE